MRSIVGKGVLTAQIIGFICILNEIFWPVALGAVEFVGNQKILVRRGKRRNAIHSSAFQSSAGICTRISSTSE